MSGTGEPATPRRSSGSGRRGGLTAAGIGLGALIGTGLAWRLSPRPSVAVLRRMGDRADSERLARLDANRAAVPESVQTLALDRRYGPDAANRLDVFAPAEPGPRPVLFWVHGGGFIGGTKDDIRSYLQVLADRGFTTVGVGYSIAPGARYPTPVLELAAALHFVLSRAEEFGVDPKRIVLAGDSAGAHIAGQLGFAIVDETYATDAGLPRPIPAEDLRALVLASGVFDLSLGADAKGVPGWIVRTILWAYSGARGSVHDPRFARASLVDHVPSGLPPVYLTAGNDDLLRGHATRFASALERAGAEVVDDIVEPDYEPAMPHDYQMDLRHDRAWSSLDRITDLVRRTAG